MASTKASPPPAASRSDTVPSSFDSSPEFFEESRFAKFTRRLREEPLIPLGCAATCYALYQAMKSIQSGDHHQTNRMFRARIYAQGFTLLAVVGGSIFWKDDRMKRKELEKVLAEKQAAEKKEKWLNELELRDREDKEWREKFEGLAVRAKEAEDAANAVGKRRAQKGAEGAQKIGREAIGGVKARARRVEDGAETGPARVKRKVEQVAGRVEEGAEKAEVEIKDRVKQGEESMEEAVEKAFPNKSILEQVERTGWGSGMWTVKEAWRRI